MKIAKLSLHECATFRIALLKAGVIRKMKSLKIIYGFVLPHSERIMSNTMQCNRSSDKLFVMFVNIDLI